MTDLKPWNARWCFLRKHLSLPWNTYAYFRKEIDLSGDVTSADVRISADARYTLYINGQRIHQGPARSHPAHQSFDELDLKPWLHSGKNAICAIIHQFGIPTFFSVYRDASGFLMDGTVETANGAIPLHTPQGWLCRPAKGWRKDVVRLSIQMGFQEHFDADADEPDWMTESFEAKADKGWKAPAWNAPVGTHPWLAMEPRNIPLLTQKIRQFTSVLSTWTGESARGYKITPDAYHFPLDEQHKREKKLLDNPEAMLRDEGESTTIHPPEDGAFVAVVLDTQTYVTGHLLLDIAEAKGDEIIDIIFSDQLDKSGFPHFIGTSEPGHKCEEASASRYRCRPGAQKWETFQYIGFRYATLIFRNIEHPLKLQFVGIRQVHADVEMTGAFETSDKKLNQIWDIARTTQLNCLFDAFVDCPQREQAQWWGDARVQAKVTAYAFGDASILARGIRQVAQSQSGLGELHAHPPSDFPHRLPDFMMTWVGTLRDYYWQTGKTDLLKEHLPQLHRLFEFFLAHEVDQGLIGNFDGWWVFLDWVDLHKADFSAVLNLLYLQATRWASEISTLAGDGHHAAAYEARALKLQQSIESRFFDESAQLWRDGFDPKTGKAIEAVSQHANALAILLGLKPDSHRSIAKDVLIKSAKSKRTKVLTGSPFFYAYILEAMIACGFRQEAVEIISSKWGEMIDNGATAFWEHWQGDHSRCHAWSSSPLYHLSQQILGVTSTEPGWKRVRIAPLPMKLEFARGVVPTPHGSLKVEWERAGDDQLAVRVDVPQGIEAEFIAPQGEKRSLPAGVSEFQA